MKENDGGPAHPVETVTNGISIHDFFAAAALTGLLSAESAEAGTWEITKLAERADAIADEMINRRE
ncbi:MAG: hypothetical protein EHM36_00110 [Deltaproteobacteria bacterium]|nr:MAG: hypothetical protein EHM36_00110 [Deltaproteobacteria bacterium]